MKKQQSVKSTSALTTTNGNNRIDVLIAMIQDQDKAAAEYEKLADRGVNLDAHLKTIGVEYSKLPFAVQKVIANQRVNEAQATATIKVSGQVYGILCQAALVNRLSSWKEALRVFVEENTIEWANEDMLLRSV